MIFTISVIFSIILLIIERSIGIEWDFHPDSVTYYEGIGNFKISETESILNYSNTLHYYVVSLLASIENVIAYNIIINAVANQIIYNRVIKKLRFGITSILLVTYLLHPYKIHLSTTLLKDTTIISLLTLSFFSNLLIISIILGLLYRNAFIFYLPLHSKIKNKKILVLILIVIFIIYTGISSGNYDGNYTNDMTFREFDNVPTFINNGAFVGSILRALVWPFITITGSFLIISPAIQYIPISIGSLILIIILIKIRIKKRELLDAYLIMSFFAVIVPGYTTYIRYIFPILAILPYIVLINRK